MSAIGAVAKVTVAHLSGWSSIQQLKFSNSLLLYFMCSDQHVKYQMSCEFPLTSSLLLDYHTRQCTHTYTHKMQDVNLSQGVFFLV